MDKQKNEQDMTEKKLSSEEIQKLVEQDKADRLQNCRSEIGAILQKHNCQIVSLPQIGADGRIVAAAQIQILP